MTSSDDSARSYPTEAQDEDSLDAPPPDAVPAPKPKPVPLPQIKLSQSFGDWKRKKEAQTQKAQTTPQPSMTVPWLDDEFRHFAPPMQPPPLPPPTLCDPPECSILLPFQPVRSPVQSLDSTSCQLPQTQTTTIPLQKLQPQIYVPRPVISKYKLNNVQKSVWMLKPPIPPPMSAISPESREEKQRLWREYRQAMKPFKNREFANAKRTIQRLSKKSKSELDEKEQARLERALEVVALHKSMLSQKAALRSIRVQDQLTDAEQSKTLSFVGAASSKEQHGNGVGSTLQNAADSCAQQIGGQRDLSTGASWGAERRAVNGGNGSFPMRNFAPGGTWNSSTGSMMT